MPNQEETHREQLPESLGYRQDIQVLRAVAVLGVVFYHAGGLLPGGFIGVDVFFVISGYVICQLIIREIKKSTNFVLDLRKFYFHRFRRLAPPLSIVIICSSLLSVILVSPLGPLRISMQTALGAQVLISNVVIGVTSGNYFDLSSNKNVFLHTWSLAVEEQFYLFFPIFCAIGIKTIKYYEIASKIRSSIVNFAFIFPLIVSLVYCVVVERGARVPLLPHSFFAWYDPAFKFYNPLSRFWEILIGSILGFATYRFGYFPQKISKFLGKIGLILIGVSLLGIVPGLLFPGLATLVPVLGTVCLLLKPTQILNPESASFVIRALIYIGDRSYSLYLIHWPIIVFASYFEIDAKGYAAAVIISMGLADLLHRKVEIPIKKYENAKAGNGSKLVCLVIVPTLAILLVVMTIDGKSLFSNRIDSLKKLVNSEHITAKNNCSNTDPRRFDLATHCIFGSNKTKTRPIYLIGDSNADHLSEAVIGAAFLLQRTVDTSIKAGCSFVAPGDFNCQRFVTEAFQHLKNSPKGDLIISLSESAWKSRTDEERLVGLTSLGMDLNYLGQNGFRILFVKPIPKFNYGEFLGTEPTGCNSLQILVFQCPLPQRAAMAAIDVNRQFALNTIKDFRSQLGIDVIDLDSFFCIKKICSTQREGALLYRDNGHMTVALSDQMRFKFKEILEKVKGSPS